MMKKCRSFVKLVNKSSTLKSYVNSVRSEFNVRRTLQLDCKSRWNSTHLLLETMLPYRKLIKRLENADWLLIESIERVLQPFVEATKLVSGRKYCTIGISFFSISQLREGYAPTASDQSETFVCIIRSVHIRSIPRNMPIL